jgi:retron-type reverse transcriptase
LYAYQSGFRHDHSTVLALIDVIDSLYERIDKHEKVTGIYLDLKKAFDTINHDLLPNKLNNYGVRGIVLEWFRDNLSNRYQFTYINNAKSVLKKVTCGVPQGSVLGPLLFFIYMNDIANVLGNSTVKLFADDTNIFIAGENLSETNVVAKSKLQCSF